MHLLCDTLRRQEPCSFLGQPPSHSHCWLARVEATTQYLPRQDTIHAQQMLYRFYAPGDALVQPPTDTLCRYTFAFPRRTASLPVGLWFVVARERLFVV